MITQLTAVLSVGSVTEAERKQFFKNTYEGTDMKQNAHNRCIFCIIYGILLVLLANFHTAISVTEVAHAVSYVKPGKCDYF